MRKARKAVSVILTLGLIIGLTSWVSAEQSLMEFLFLKSGKKVKCDAVWKGMGDYIWCSRSGNIKGYPNDEVDLVRTFQVQPLFNKKVNQSLASFRQGDWDGVIREASDALILDPDNEFAYTNRAAAYIGKGLFRKAIEDCNAAIEANARYGLAYSNRGFALELLGERYHAGMDYDTGCKLGSELGCDNYTRLVVEKKHFNVQPIVDNLVDRSLEQFRQGDWDGVISNNNCPGIRPRGCGCLHQPCRRLCQQRPFQGSTGRCQHGHQIEPQFCSSPQQSWVCHGTYGV